MQQQLQIVMPVLLILVFAIVGILLIYQSIGSSSRFKKRCTLPVRVKCIDIKKRNFKRKGRKGKAVYMPIYSAYINGEEMELSNNIASTKKPTIGAYYDILVNPENPHEFVDANTKDVNMILIIAGAMLIAIALFTGAFIVLLPVHY